MNRGLFFTTMANHRPVYTSTSTNIAYVPREAAPEAERRFHATAARDPTDMTRNPNNPPSETLRNILSRSTQPTFSVSAMFGVRSGSGCGSCGH